MLVVSVGLLVRFVQSVSITTVRGLATALVVVTTDTFICFSLRSPSTASLFSAFQLLTLCYVSSCCLVLCFDSVAIISAIIVRQLIKLLACPFPSASTLMIASVIITVHI